MIKRIITMLSGNSFIQRVLEKNIFISLYLTGVGSGGGVQQSGERAVFKLLGTGKDPLCVFDVGANKGQYLNMVYNEFLNREVEIHSFEPGSFTFDILKKKSPDSPKVKLNNIGLGETEGEFTLYYDEQGSGLASLTKRRLDHFSIGFDNSEKIHVITLDDYCAQNDVKYIHLLKLDVEGHEMDVLKGSMKMFASGSIGIVTFEFGGCNIDTRSFFQDFYYFFKEQKMQLFRITPSGYLFKVKKYSEQYEQFLTTNFVAAKIA